MLNPVNLLAYLDSKYICLHSLRHFYAFVNKTTNNQGIHVCVCARVRVCAAEDSLCGGGISVCDWWTWGLLCVLFTVPWLCLQYSATCWRSLMLSVLCVRGHHLQKQAVRRPVAAGRVAPQCNVTLHQVTVSKIISNPVVHIFSSKNYHSCSRLLQMCLCDSYILF